MNWSSLALAFVKVPWMIAVDCGWATIFYCWRNKLSLCYCKIEILEIGRERRIRIEGKVIGRERDSGLKEIIKKCRRMNILLNKFVE